MTNESVWAGSYAPGVPLHLDYGTETLVERVERAARKFSDRPAIDFMGQVTSYGDLARDVHRVAAALVEMGLERAETVCAHRISLPWACGGTATNASRFRLSPKA